MDQELNQKERMLKRVVVVLGILLVLAALVVFGTIAYRASNLGAEDPETAAASGGGGKFEDRSILMPPGSRVVSTTVTATEIHALMYTPFGQRLVVIDRASGEILGTFRFNQQQSQ